MGTKPRVTGWSDLLFALGTTPFLPDFPVVGHWYGPLNGPFVAAVMFLRHFSLGRKIIYQNRYSFHHEEGGILSNGLCGPICDVLYKVVAVALYKEKSVSNHFRCAKISI